MTSASATSDDPERHAGRLAGAGSVALVLGVALGEWYGGLLALLGVILFVFACRSRDGFLLLGPFVRLELIRAARGRRLALWRFLYAAVAALILVICFSDALLNPGGLASSRRLFRYTEAFFITFSVVQFCYLTYLTISLISPIVAEEREAKRWDFLLATDLRAREIMVGKTVGRLPQILDPILAALPVLVLSTLFGGVSPRLVIAVTAATTATMLSTIGIAFFFSVFSRTAKVANEQTSGILIAYVVLSGVLLVLNVKPGVWTFPTSVGLNSSIEVGDLVELFGTGNPLVVVVLASRNAATGTATFEPLFEAGVRRYVAFHLGVMCYFGLTAMQRMRSATPWQGPQKKVPPEVAKVEPEKPAKVVPNHRPPIGEWPVYWLERYGQMSQNQMKATNRYTWKAFLGIGLAFVVLLIGAHVADEIWPQEAIRRTTTVLMRFAVWALACVCLFPPAVRAARSVARERAADTLDALLLTALTPREILFQKWLGCVTADLPLYWMTLTVCAAGVVTGFVPPLAPLAVAVTVPVFAGAGAAIGMYFSVRGATAARAIRNFVLIGAGFLYLVGLLLTNVLKGFGAIIAFPPAAVGAVFIPGVDRGAVSWTDYILGATGVACSLGLYSAIGFLAWDSAVKRFDRERHN